jgi:RNA-directed DNA polymerase
MNNRDISDISGGGDGTSSIFHKTVSLSNLLSAWNEFKKGKRNKRDVAFFELYLEDNLLKLNKDLLEKRYIHDIYESFFVCDPKRRHIHKASVRDRVLHQAVFQNLYKILDPHFIYDSYSSRNSKGTHAGVARLVDACRKVSHNWRKETYVLKCDVRKFFASIDHNILRELIVNKIKNRDMLWLIDKIFDSFENNIGKGLPLGNVTSQLFANIYMNEFDQFAKHELKSRYYLRYCDDFVIVHNDKKVLENSIVEIRNFLKEKLCLDLHPHKVEIRKLSQGVDFLGYVVLPHTQVIRTKTKQRIFRKIDEAKNRVIKGSLDIKKFEASISSYLGVMSHAQNKKLVSKIEKLKAFFIA